MKFIWTHPLLEKLDEKARTVESGITFDDDDLTDKEKIACVIPRDWPDLVKLFKENSEFANIYEDHVMEFYIKWHARLQNARLAGMSVWNAWLNGYGREGSWSWRERQRIYNYYEASLLLTDNVEESLAEMGFSLVHI